MGITFAYFVLHFDEFCPVSGAQPIYAHGIFRLTTTIEKIFPHYTTLASVYNVNIYNEIDFTPC